jgi:hypothetical protein
MNAMTFMAFAKPYNLATILYIGHSGEDYKLVEHKALDIIDHLPAGDDYKDMLRKTLSIWTTDIWKKVVFEGMTL